MKKTIIGLFAIVLMTGCSRHVGNQPMPDYVRSQGQAFTAPTFFNFLPQQSMDMVPLAGNFCGVIGYAMNGNSGDQHNISVIPASGMWHGHVFGTATMDVECAPCSNFVGIASCANGSAASFQTESNGMTGAPNALDGSHIWQPGHFFIVNQGIGGGGNLSNVDLFGITPPLQGFGVSAVTGATVTGNAYGVQFLNSSGQVVTPQLNVTFFYFQTLGGAQVDLGRDDAGQCWLGGDFGDSVVDIFVNKANPPHKILDATRLGNNYAASAWCLAYSF